MHPLMRFIIMFVFIYLVKIANIPHFLEYSSNKSYSLAENMTFE